MSMMISPMLKFGWWLSVEGKVDMRGQEESLEVELTLIIAESRYGAAGWESAIAWDSTTASLSGIVWAWNSAAI